MDNEPVVMSEEESRAMIRQEFLRTAELRSFGADRIRRSVVVHLKLPRELSASEVAQDLKSFRLMLEICVPMMVEKLDTTYTLPSEQQRQDFIERCQEKLYQYLTGQMVGFVPTLPVEQPYLVISLVEEENNEASLNGGIILDKAEGHFIRFEPDDAILIKPAAAQ